MAASNGSTNLQAIEDFGGVEIFTSLRYDPLLEQCDQNNITVGINRATPYYMIGYHFDRLLEAANFFGWKVSENVLPDVTAFESKLTEDMAREGFDRIPFKIRFAIGQDGNISIGYMRIPPVSLQTLYPTKLVLPDPTEVIEGVTKVFVDTERSLTGFFTTYKTNLRTIYDQARDRFKKVLGSGVKAEVLIICHDDEVLEGTLTSVYFFRNGRWVTPPVGTGSLNWKGHKGTTRRWALERGLCFEETVLKGSVSEGEMVWLSNGARGFWLGQVSVYR